VVPGLSTLETEGSGELVTDSVMSHSSTVVDISGASLSHPDAAELKGAALRSPTTSFPDICPDW